MTLFRTQILVQLIVMTRMNYFISAGVGETGVPREKPTIKPLFMFQLVQTNLSISSTSVEEKPGSVEMSSLAFSRSVKRLDLQTSALGTAQYFIFFLTRVFEGNF